MNLIDETLMINDRAPAVYLLNTWEIQNFLASDVTQLK